MPYEVCESKHKQHWCGILVDADALAGIAIPARSSAFNSIETVFNAKNYRTPKLMRASRCAKASNNKNTPLNTKVLACFDSIGPWGLLEAFFLIL